MKPRINLLVISIALLTSCSSGHPPIDVPEASFDSTASDRIRAYKYDPYEIDSVCKFNRPKDGELVGEWMIMDGRSGIASEVNCFFVKMDGFNTRTEKRWVIKSDGIIETHASDVTLKDFRTDTLTIRRHSNSWKYKKLGVSDTILMFEMQYMLHDTFRIVRLEADTLIIGSTSYDPDKGPETRSVLFYRRK